MSDESSSDNKVTLPDISGNDKQFGTDAEKRGAKVQLVDDDDESVAYQQGVKPAFIAKVHHQPSPLFVLCRLIYYPIQVNVLNRAISECGMGRYQVCRRARSWKHISHPFFSL